MELKTKTKEIASPVLLVTLGITIGAAAIAILFTQTSLFTKEEPEVTITPTPTVSVTLEVTQPPITIPFLSPEDEIKEQLILISGIPREKMEFSMGEEREKIARGSIVETGTVSGAGWFASKEGYVWTVDYLGQGVPECDKVEDKGYPTDWISHCTEANGTTKAL